MLGWQRVAILAFAAWMLASCTSTPAPAPLQVIDIEEVPDVLIDPNAPIQRSQVHVVARGETLGEIALAYGLSYRDIALWNNLANPDLIEVGQQLTLVAPKGQAKVIPLQTAITQKPSVTNNGQQPQPTSRGVTRTKVGIGSNKSADGRRISAPAALKLPYSPAAFERLQNQSQGGAEQASLTLPARSASVPGNIRDRQGITWSWPVTGRLASKFSDSNRGIDIAGPRGQPVFASADGKVIYAGTGLKGYGQLVIIKHANEYLSTYAHNDKILIAEGAEVQRGDQIAEMGDTGTDRVRLHFEIRRGEQTFDPQQFLPPNP